ASPTTETKHRNHFIQNLIVCSELPVRSYPAQQLNKLRLRVKGYRCADGYCRFRPSPRGSLRRSFMVLPILPMVIGGCYAIEPIRKSDCFFKCFESAVYFFGFMRKPIGGPDPMKTPTEVLKLLLP